MIPSCPHPRSVGFDTRVARSRSGARETSIVIERVFFDPALGLDLSSIADVPMRWIRGDTMPHIDHVSGNGQDRFRQTYLMYLNDCPGEFVLAILWLGIRPWCLRKGSPMRCKTLLGSMNENGVSVGISVAYFGSESDALAVTNVIQYGSNYTIIEAGGFTEGRVCAHRAAAEGNACQDGIRRSRSSGNK